MNDQPMPIILKTMIGDYPITHLFRSGHLSSPRYAFEFADVKVPNTAFKRMVRNLEFDVSELAIVTFLQALDAGIPLVLLPAVIVSRYQHPFLMFDSRRGIIRPQDLRGKRIGVRSYSVTTVAWIRGMLQAEFGIEPHHNRWVAFDEGHVAQWVDPHWVERADPAADMLQMLEAGELDAAVLAAAPADKPHIQPVFANPAEQSQRWFDRHGVIQINHMIALKRSLVEQHPDVAKTVMALIAESADRGLSDADRPAHPLGLTKLRPHLEHAIEMVHRQGLIRERFSVESLFHPTSQID
ncbi:MAG: ABC transporter substrate-binding protein [Betaproteobacteria bacterium]|nr:ABC transporter substrate-binding protein [Betaproteobacteria bacterium]